MTTLLALEIGSFVFDLIFISLLIREIKWCWIFGIVGSLLGAFVLYKSLYYSESLLYIFYAVMGIYGWKVWNTQEVDFKISQLKTTHLLLTLVLGGIATYLLGYFMSRTNADRPFYDAFSSVFGVIATFLEINKILMAWIFWIVLNGFSIWLYGIKDLNFFTAKMIIYTGLSIWGYMQWRSKIQ